MISSSDVMDEEMEEFIAEPFADEEVDLAYEFDAVKYYDFTRLETEMEAREAECWFDSAQSYPPSPFVIKLNWRRIMMGKCTIAESKDGKKINNVSSEVMESKVPAKDENVLDIQEIEVKSPVKTNLSRSSTLMKPTASHLAKQKQSPGAYTNRLMQRHQKNFSSIEEKDKNSSMYNCQDTKRQKLEAGFIRKVAPLKHQPLLVHKIPQKAGILNGSITVRKSKITVPKEPILATAHRALRRRFRNHEVLSQQSNTSSRVFKARTLNRKIFEAPMLPTPKKKVPQLPEFQVFHLKTSERAAHQVSNDLETSCSKSISHIENMNTKRPNYLSAPKQVKNRVVTKSKNVSLCKKILSPKEDVDDLQSAEREITIPKPYLEEPPVLLLSKLSLRSESEHKAKSQCYGSLPDKGLKENTPDSFHQVHEVGGKCVLILEPNHNQHQHRIGKGMLRDLQ